MKQSHRLIALLVAFVLPLAACDKPDSKANGEQVNIVGKPDPEFGVNGTYYSSLSRVVPRGAALLVQPDDKAIVIYPKLNWDTRY